MLISRLRTSGKKTNPNNHKNQQFPTQNTFYVTHKRSAYGSRITLTSPDPSAVSPHKRAKRDTVESDTHEVTFIPYDDESSGTADEVTRERKIADEL